MSDHVKMCSGETMKSGSWHPSRCKRTARVERNGVPYCTIHDPERRAAKQAEQYAKWDAEDNKRKELQALFASDDKVSVYLDSVRGWRVAFAAVTEAVVRELAERLAVRRVKP